MTINMLSAADIPFDTVNIDEKPEIAEQLKQEGHRSAPVVKVTTDDNEVDAWTGFRIEKVRDYILKYGDLAV